MVHLTVALYIVLTTGKVPHEIAPVHVVELISEEELQVLSHSRLDGKTLLKRIPLGILIECSVYRLATHTDPINVSLWMRRRRAVYSREEHIELGSHLVLLLMSGEDVFIGIAGLILDFLSVQSFPLIDNRAEVGTVSTVDRLRVECGAVEKRTVTVLLSVEVR